MAQPQDDHSIEVEAQPPDDQSSLDVYLLLAIAGGHQAEVERLLEEGARHEFESSDCSYSLFSTPLITAAANGRIAIMKMLLNREANIDFLGWHRHLPSIQQAVEGRVSYIDTLIKAQQLESMFSKYFPEVTGNGLNPKDDYRSKGMEIHIKANWRERHECYPWTTGYYRATALVTAAEQGQTESVRFLLAHGATVDMRDTRGATALGKAGEAKVIRLLAEEAGPNNGHIYALTNHPVHTEMVRLFIEHGADIDARCGEDFTPLMWTIIMENTACVKLLLDAGADMWLVDVDQRTALDHANVIERDDILSLMMDALTTRVTTLQQACRLTILRKTLRHHLVQLPLPKKLIRYLHG